MIANKCRHCRRVMRIWAHDARKQTRPEMRRSCVSVARGFRNECLCRPNGKAIEPPR